MDHVSSYYAASANASPQRPALKGDRIFDVCVVGAGFSGLSAALHLAEKGRKVAVIEGAKVGWGASGRNGGQIVNGYSRDYDSIKFHYGEDTANAVLSMSFEGGDIIRERIKTYSISCDYKEGGFFAALNKGQMDYLERRKAIWEKAGNKNLEMFGHERMPEIVGTGLYCGGLLDRSGGHIHPLNLALGQAAALEKLGGVIFEDTRLLNLEKGAKPVVVTEHGRITADIVILCGNAYMTEVGEIESKVMPVSTQVITTEPLGDNLARRILPQDHCLEDCNYFLDYYRMTGDKRLLFGGGVIYGGATPANIIGKLHPRMLRTFPFLKDKKIEFAWSGNCAFTFTRIPHIGRLSDNVYFAHGYSGHGVTTSHLMGRLLAEAVHHQTSRFDVFANIRNFPFPGGRTFRVPLTVLGAWYYRVKEFLGL